MNADLDADAYNRHAPRLMALAAALVGPADAGDVVSSAITRLIATEPARRIENLEAYLTRAVVNEARSWARSRARRSARDARWIRQTADRDADAIQALRDPDLTAVILRLPIRQRAVIVLSYWADLDPAAIAVQLGISEGSVRKHLARARASLREAWA
jgi:RNA polymerase sigma factor (sigma-70 family)